MPAQEDAPRVFPVDDFVRDELYPGYRQAFGSQPFVAGPVRPFSRADNARYWLRDSLHFSEGMVPASIATLDDAQTWGAQLGAEIVGVPPTRGSVNRLAGHARVHRHHRRGHRVAGAGAGGAVRPVRVADPAPTSTRYWAMRAGELQAAYDHFDNLDLSAMSPAELWTALKDAYAFHRRAWFIHFEVMYVLTANYLAFYALAEEIGLAGSQVSVVPVRAADVLQQDRRGAVAAGRPGARARGHRAAAARVAGRHARPARGAAARRGAGWPSSTRSWRSTGSGPRRPAGSTRRPGSRTRRRALYAIGAFLSKPAGFDFHAARAAADRRARRADRGGAALGQRRRTCARFNEALAVEPGGQLRLVERGAQLPDRPAGRDPGAPRHAGARRAAGRRRADRATRRTCSSCSSRSCSSVMEGGVTAAGARGRSWPR